ncbi:hypothetical protein ACFQNF_04915 [Iodobacter arcticus]|uniref:Uncharacterized protein n=1 Tax=Iodobacter arcticus TaxID=590593 RepID=A0ABW2QZ83_9NEIS
MRKENNAKIINVMSGLKQITMTVAGIFMAMTFLAHASECESIPAAVLIHDWVGELPKQAELQIYKGDSKFFDKKNQLSKKQV